MISSDGSKAAQNLKLRCWFDHFHSVFLKEICAHENSLRPIPPILGDDGRCADLFKLFLVVREKGGCNVVSKKGLWGSVAEESGLGLNFAAAVKLVYIKYLDTFERWLDRIFVEEKSGICCLSISSDVGRYLMELKAEFKGFLKSFGDEDVVILEPETVDQESFSRNKKKRKKCGGDDNGDCVLELDGEKGSDENSNLGLKDGDRDSSSFTGILDWIMVVARDPCDPGVGSLPEPLKWKYHDNQEIWKQVLLAREAIFLKRNLDSGSEHSTWQKNQRMHPSMYGDQLGSNYNLRERMKCGRKLLNGNTASQREADSESSQATSELDRSVSGSDDQIDKLGTAESSVPASLIDRYNPSRIPIGQAFQAEVPEWTWETYESDTKWLGSKAWPLDKSEQKFLVERDPIGKGRQDSCGCQEVGSVECVRFHIAEKRLRVKRELGSAFYVWRFGWMGEEVHMSWTKDEQKKFKDTVSSNLSSLESSFWDQIVKAFPTKSRADLVSYYYNVYILRRRAHQNRFTPSNIDSDDEESEPGLVTNGFGHEAPNSKKSILLTPNKQQKK
ncbi:AT-rich interactive domain-containing protein 1 isoform X2 [Morus notabilis]|nr:AT-rich interactive domain-containing protein 1 isoform X2 [Morus notabilis]